MESNFKCKSIDSQMVRVAILSQQEKNLARSAGKLLGLRQSEFYRRAIVEKAQSVLSSLKQEASSPRDQSQGEGASFSSEE